MLLSYRGFSVLKTVEHSSVSLASLEIGSRLPRGIVESPSLETFKILLDTFLLILM